jgi:hypothetical protein
VKIYVAAVHAGAQEKKWKDKMKLRLPPKLMGKTGLGPSQLVISFR